MKAEENIMFDVEALNALYEDLSATDGMSVTAFHKRIAMLFAEDRSTSDKKDYRSGKKPWKKLSDEIMPVSRFLKYKKIEVGRVRFPLDDPPDCWLLNDNGDDLGIEVTIERGRERYHLAKEMNDTGRGRGFIGIQDDASQTDFDHSLSRPRTGFYTEQFLEATKAGITRCLLKKNNDKYAKVYYLLIQAHSSHLPKEYWDSITGELSQEAKGLPFQEVYIIESADEEPWGLRIK